MVYVYTQRGGRRPPARSAPWRSINPVAALYTGTGMPILLMTTRTCPISRPVMATGRYYARARALAHNTQAAAPNGGIPQGTCACAITCKQSPGPPTCQPPGLPAPLGILPNQAIRRMIRHDPPIRSIIEYISRRA